MRAHWRLVAAVILAAAATGCGNSLPPFDTAPAPAPPNAHEDFSRIGVCYNSLTASRENVIAVARANCDPGTTPYLVSEDARLDCPLLIPQRATFACVKSGTPPPPVPR